MGCGVFCLLFVLCLKKKKGSKGKKILMIDVIKTLDVHKWDLRQYKLGLTTHTFCVTSVKVGTNPVPIIAASNSRTVSVFWNV